ncbi:MAG: fibronectin type III domain-containing protein [Allomuricauda sp.]
MISIQKFKGLANAILNEVKNLFLVKVSVSSLQLVVCNYNKLLKVLLPAYCLLLCCQLSNAQIYPVQVTPQMVPPYSFKLSDYTTTTQEKLFVNLLLTDAQESGRQVRLQLFVEGPGINFQSVDFVSGAVPIVLDGGINQRLTNLDLQPYFNLNNLVGISPRQYSQQLPEGQYRFCFEVYDQFSGQRISNRSCANIFLILNDPPILNVPGRGDLIMAQDPQNIIFNWTPRHINAGAVQYEFTLKELWDTGMDPQAAFLASPPLYQITNFANTLHYGPAQMQLLEGKTYGWQVRAFVSDGNSDTSLFRNNGLSEIFHFTYQADCPPPHFVLSEAQNSQTVNITWQMGEHLRYRVQYRKKGYGDNDWFGLWSQGNEATLRNLEAGTVYEFRVGGDCTAPLSVSPGGGNGSGVGLAFSPIHEFTTPTEDEMAYYNCGIPPEIEITNQDPLQNLGVNEVFRAGDFPVVVREASGSNGYFSGWGYITLPFLENLKEVIDVANIATGGDVNVGKFTRIRVEFDNIKINTDYQLVEGMVETSYDPNWSGIVDVDEAIADIKMTLAQLVEMLSNIGIDSTTKENIKALTEMLVQQAQEELPQPISDKIQAATDKMNSAKEQYDSAIANGNQELASQAEQEFKEAQEDLKEAEKEKDDFLDAYASIIKDALKEIVRESDTNLDDGLNQYGAENIAVKETGENLELNSTDLDQLSSVLQFDVSTTNEQDQTGYFEYERWNMLNFISTNLQTDEGTKELGNVLENEGEKLGIYIYNRLEEGAKKGDLTLEIKELIIETITKKIALSTKLY